MYGMVGVGSNGVNKWNLFDIEWLSCLCSMKGRESVTELWMEYECANEDEE